MENIKIGKTYYFNNREVVVLRMETPTIAFCVATFDITHGVTGSGFCTACNIGGMSSHDCDEYDYAIEAIMEEISDEQVLWIPVVYLKEKPVEFKANDELLKDIEDKKIALESLIKHVKTLNEEGLDAQDYSRELEDQINDLEAKRDKLGVEVLELDSRKAERELELNTVIKIQGSDITITAKELLKLYKSDIELDLLNAGKVSSWQWYDASIGDVDIDNEALNMLIKK